jgi:hypothetical protein
VIDDLDGGSRVGAHGRASPREVECCFVLERRVLPVG